jgi:hypothetical protein
MSQKRLLEDAIAEEEEARKAAAPEPPLFHSLNIAVYHAVDLSKEQYGTMRDRIKGKFQFSDPQPGGEGRNVYTEDGDFVSTAAYDELYIYRYPEGDDAKYALLGFCILAVGVDDTSAGLDIQRSIKKWYRNLKYDDDWSRPTKELLDRVYADMLGAEAGITHEHCCTSTVTEVREGVHYSVSMPDSLAPRGLNIVAYYGFTLTRKEYKQLKIRCAGVFEFTEPKPGRNSGQYITRVSDGSVLCTPAHRKTPEYYLTMHRHAGVDKQEYMLIGVQVACRPASDLLGFARDVRKFRKARHNEDWDQARRVFFDDVVWQMAEKGYDCCEMITVYEKE